MKILTVRLETGLCFQGTSLGSCFDRKLFIKFFEYPFFLMSLLSVLLPFMYELVELQEIAFEVRLNVSSWRYNSFRKITIV